MFAATLTADRYDSQRTQNLTLAALLALGGTSTVLASLWTLDRLNIDRVGGVQAELDITQISLLAPPKLIEPPAAPKLIESGQTDPQPAQSPKRSAPKLAATPVGTDDGLDSDPIPKGPSALDGDGVPTGRGCPGGVCKAGPALPIGGCVGTHCGKGTDTGTESGIGSSVAPMAVEFSALRCLACPDPNKADLRKTAASAHHERGQVHVNFCVDAKGRVDKASVKVRKSFGDREVDRIARDAVKSWRFKAMTVGGKARRACSETTFNIRFE